MDSRLQSLHRAWQASGSTADEAAYLLERLRVGDLTTERLELAAWLGMQGAREAMPGRQWPDVPTGRLSATSISKFAENWAEPLRSPEIRKRTCVALVRTALLEIAKRGFPGERHLSLMKEAIGFLNGSPSISKDHLLRVSAELTNAFTVPEHKTQVWDFIHRLAITTVYVVVDETDQSPTPGWVEDPAKHVSTWLDLARSGLGNGRKGLEAALSGVRCELIPWLLNEPTPEPTP